ncbi:MAG: tetratricopeptide repeat protein [Candidatus Stygibacter australis]|nr:tetratricopeptide repeat protein [Candidatus Stygibacter australis]
MENTDKIKSLYEKGSKLVEEDQTEEAIAIFNEIISLDPGFYKAYFQRAHLYMSSGDIDNAISDFSAGLEIKQDAYAYLLRASAYDTKEMFEQSSRDYSKVIKLESDPGILYFAHLNRGSAFNYLERYSEAVEDFTKAMEINPEDPKAFRGRAIAYFHLNQIDKSIDDWSTVIKLTPDDAEPYKKRASLYFQIDRSIDAIKDSTKSIELDHNDIESYIIRGSSYLKESDVIKAKTDLQFAKNKGNEAAAQLLIEIDMMFDVDTLLEKGNKALLEKDYESAFNHLSKAQAVSNAPNVLTSLATALKHLGRFEDAIFCLEKALNETSDPETLGSVTYNLGNIFRETDRFEDAIKWYIKSIKFRPDHIGVHYNLGMSYEAIEEHDLAIKELETVLQIDPKLNDVRSRIELIKETGNDIRSEKIPDSAGDSHFLPENKELRENIARATEMCARDDEFEEIIFHLEKILKIDPECSDPEFLLVACIVYSGIALKLKDFSPEAKNAVKFGRKLLAIEEKKSNPSDDILFSAYRALLLGYFRLNEYDQAKEFGTKALKIIPDSEVIIKLMEWLQANRTSEDTIPSIQTPAKPKAGCLGTIFLMLFYCSCFLYLLL